MTVVCLKGDGCRYLYGLGPVLFTCSTGLNFLLFPLQPATLSTAPVLWTRKEGWGCHSICISIRDYHFVLQELIYPVVVEGLFHVCAGNDWHLWSRAIMGIMMMGSQALTFCFLRLSPQVLMMAPLGMLLGLLVTSWVTVCFSCKNSVSVFLSNGAVGGGLGEPSCLQEHYGIG